MRGLCWSVSVPSDSLPFLDTVSSASATNGILDKCAGVKGNAFKLPEYVIMAKSGAMCYNRRRYGRARGTRGSMSDDTTEQREQSRYISVAEMAADLEVSERTIRTALAKGRLRGLYLGTRAGWRVTREDYEVWKRSLDNQQGRVNTSTPEERYQIVLAGRTFTCPECASQQVLPMEMKPEQDQSLGTIHVIACPQCLRRYGVCFDRLDTVGVRTHDGPWETRSFTWLLGTQSPEWSRANRLAGR
jgi:excisionase family DNA binding protein